MRTQRGTMTDQDDPWAMIEPPSHTAVVSGQRVDPDLPWGIYWAVDLDRRCLLVLRHERESKPETKLPRLRGLEVESRNPASVPYHLLVLRLLDGEHREIFHRLCIDIVSATQDAVSEKEAVALFLGRTWRWHRLLQGRRPDRLSDEEQKGLIGELLVLRDMLFPISGVETALRSWTGPTGAPKDFELGTVCIESKARRGAATPQVAIASEVQLDTSGIDALYLHVADITGAPSGVGGAVTISDVVVSVVSEVAAKAPALTDLLDQRLLSAGFDAEVDYSDSKWLVGTVHVFEVRDGFPRISTVDVPAGVRDLRYSVSLADCEPFRLELGDLKVRLKEAIS
ncbi:MAG: PD-(D/E)XK motif protein [Gammaproteobacteria bacterium]|nr:PD-(D/E)XK motif protein [Gammaproteobacteria bacterium]